MAQSRNHIILEYFHDQSHPHIKTFAIVLSDAVWGSLKGDKQGVLTTL